MLAHDTDTGQYLDDPGAWDRRYRRLWAGALIQAGLAAGALPPYGARDWRRLPQEDPRRVAACVVAAECWRSDDDDLETRLRRELYDLAVYGDRLDRASFMEVAEHVQRYASRPTHVELLARRRLT